ncbi:thioredoxin family protein [Candidatus Nomurabacteria bacterium]|nr:thioredoxin family protein [Candidatus Nomurabacteria bacterium]
MKKIEILFFTAPGCGPCSIVYPVLEEILKENPSLVFQKVSIDLEENTEIASRFRVRNVPTTIFLKDGEETKRIIGASKASDYQKTVKQLIDAS